jgi:hypothetical protein
VPLGPASRPEPAIVKNGRVRDALLAAGAQHVVGARAPRVEAVAVLHAGHRRDGLGLGQATWLACGQAQVPDQPGVAQ